MVDNDTSNYKTYRLIIYIKLYDIIDYENA